MSQDLTIDKRQPWIEKTLFDVLFILFPPFGCLLFILLFPSFFTQTKNMPDVWWVVLVLLIDVAHVYSTLYRTYFDKEAFEKQRTILIGIPFIAFIASVLLYTISNMLFWRILAYVAVYHFIRQQYGFLRLYSRRENAPRLFTLIDNVTIYYSTIYPIIYWHVGSPRNFNWFVNGDFFYFESQTLMFVTTSLYYFIIGVYLIKEIVTSIVHRFVNLPKLLLVTGTVVSWYFGIVFFNGDMAFTLLNVVSHGIPYMALIWVHSSRKFKSTGSGGVIIKYVFSRYGIIVFLSIIFLLAFLEEGLWDMTVWKEHKNVFQAFRLNDLKLSNEVLCFVVPLLALPQITHYIIDGYIWKVRKDKSLQR
jgi:hypothetical protein